jgi:O-antigen/teichoic acid export membrane protein
LKPGEEGLLKNLVSKLTTDSLRYLPATVIPAGLSIVSVYIFTRLFDTLDYGRYALVIASTTIATVFLSGWIQQSVLRYLPKFKTGNKLGEFVMELFVILAGVSSVFILLLAVLFRIFEIQLADYRAFFIPAVILIVAESMFLCFGSIYQADLKSKAFARSKIAGAILRLALALAFVLFIQKEIIGLIVGAAAANLIVVAFMMRDLKLWQKIFSSYKYVNVNLLKTFAQYGLPMVGWILCGQVLEISDRFLIGYFRGSAEVGIYSANYNLVRMGFNLVSGPFLTASYPLIITAWEKGNRDNISSIISEFSRYYLLMLLPVAMVIGIFSREIVAIVLGEQFRSGYTIFPYVLGGMMLWGLGMIGHKGLEILEKTRLMLLLVVAAAGLNVVLNLVLIPRYGYNGAAAATFLSYLVYPLLVYLVSAKGIAWRLPWRSVGRTAAAALVMAGVMLGLKSILPGNIPPLIGVIIAALIGLLVYIVILLVLKELRPYEKQLFSRK